VKAVVVYESLWGNTAAVASAIGEGIGPGTGVLSTAEASPEALEGADLIVAGSPVLAFKLPTEKIREGLRKTPGDAPRPADLSHPSMHSWLEGLPTGTAWSAAFDTQVKGPWGKAAPTIGKGLERAGHRSIAKPAGFIMAGKYGPPREGELERAREWGAALAQAVARKSESAG
jgi:hypothetical protein